MSSTRYAFGCEVLYRTATVPSVAATITTHMAFLRIRILLIQAAACVKAGVNLELTFLISDNWSTQPDFSIPPRYQNLDLIATGSSPFFKSRTQKPEAVERLQVFLRAFT